jgi:hypothetical protein
VDFGLRRGAGGRSVTLPAAGTLVEMTIHQQPLAGVPAVISTISGVRPDIHNAYYYGSSFLLFG